MKSFVVIASPIVLLLAFTAWLSADITQQFPAPPGAETPAAQADYYIGVANTQYEIAVNSHCDAELSVWEFWTYCIDARVEWYLGCVVRYVDLPAEYVTGIDAMVDWGESTSDTLHGYEDDLDAAFQLLIDAEQMQGIDDAVARDKALESLTLINTVREESELISEAVGSEYEETGHYGTVITMSTELWSFLFSLDDPYGY